MTSTFDSAVAGMAKAVRSSRGVAVTYHRGSEALPITATPAEDRYAINDADGVPVQMFVRDYLFSAADLDFGKGLVTPERGDRIKERFGDVVKVFEVVNLGGEPAWRYVDPGHTEVRVHTKQVDAEAA